MAEKTDPLTVNRFTKYLEDQLEGDLKNALSQEKVGCQDILSRNKAQAYLDCCLLMAKNAHREYSGLKNCIVSAYGAYTGQIENNVKAYLSLDEEITKAVKTSVDAIFASKTKIKKVRDLACKCDTAKNDSCNSEQIKAITDALTFTDPQDNVTYTGTQAFYKHIDFIEACSKGLYNDVDNIFEKSVALSGILAFRNTTSLSDPIKKLKEQVDKLAKDVDTNLKDLLKKVEEDEKAYTEGLLKLIEAEMNSYNSHILKAGLNRVKDHINNTLKGYDQCTSQDKTALKDQLDAINQAIMEITFPENEPGGGAGGSVTLSEEPPVDESLSE